MAYTEEKKDQKYIIALLKKKGPLITDNIIDEMKVWKKESYAPDCNDRTLRNLIFLKKNKVIQGKMNVKKKTWEWFL